MHYSKRLKLRGNAGLLKKKLDNLLSELENANEEECESCAI